VVTVTGNGDSEREPSGFVGMQRVLEACPLGGTDKLILLGIASHYPRSHPGLDTLAGYARVHPDSARRALRRLEDGGWITTIPNAGVSHGGNRTNRYVIQWDRLDTPAPASVDTPAPASEYPRAGAGGTVPEPTRVEQTREYTASPPAATAHHRELIRHLGTQTRAVVLTETQDELLIADVDDAVTRRCRFPDAVTDAWCSVGTAIFEWCREYDAPVPVVAEGLDTAATRLTRGKGRAPSYVGVTVSRFIADDQQPGHAGAQYHDDVVAAITHQLRPGAAP
jgi:hypothetical protein